MFYIQKDSQCYFATEDVWLLAETVHFLFRQTIPKCSDKSHFQYLPFEALRTTHSER